MAPSTEQRILRNALGSFATGVTIVTTRDADGADIGRTANSFSSVSLDPPMILWSLARTSSSLGIFQQAEHFAVHILAVEQQGLSNLFAGKSKDRFAGIDIERGVGGVPLLKGCAARFECRTVHQYEGGDHIIFVAEVTDFTHSSSAPLLFHGGGYGRIMRPKAETRSFATRPETLSPNDLTYLISRLFHDLRDTSARERRKIELTDAEYAILTLLGHDDGQSVADLLRLAAQRGAEVDRPICDQMEGSGLIQLSDSATAETHAFLTPKGREKMTMVVAAIKSAEARCLSRLDENERWILLQLLGQVASANDKGWPPAPAGARN
ncbi:flavin reductase [Roseovarius aestuarii]|nr:flavin reductase [Roseovarius aestuarii]